MVSLFDKAMAEVGGGEWIYTHPLQTPKIETTTEQSVAEPISAQTFTEAVLRPAAGVRTAWAVAQVLRNVPEFGNIEGIGIAIKEKRYGDLPDPIRIPQGVTMPPDATFGVVIDNHSDGTMDIIKTIVFVKPVQMRTARALFSGDIMVPAWRPGPWAVKKAFQSLLDKVLGYHVTWSTVTPKPVKRAMPTHGTQQTMKSIRAGSTLSTIARLMRLRVI